MGEGLFREGGPHNVRRTGEDLYEMSIPLPTDEEGMLARECPDVECAPGYFKIKPGTGLTGEQPEVYCPYCRQSGHQTEFHTEAQHNYARDVMSSEATAGVQRMLNKALGLGPSGKRVLADGLLKITLSQEPLRKRPVAPPIEEELARDLVCPVCTLHHAVFGLAFWCPDCGADVFLTHLTREYDTIRQVLAAIDSRREALGNRVAVRDRENALEDVVSVFEAAGKLVIWRWLMSNDKPRDDIAEILSRRVRNLLQNTVTASAVFMEHCGLDPLGTLETSQRAALEGAFNKRHPITHNLGVVDRKYLARARSLAQEGKELRLTSEEVGRTAEISYLVLQRLHDHLFPKPAAS